MSDPVNELGIDAIVDMMRELSRQTDPQEMVRVYGERVRNLLPIDRRISLSRRGLRQGQYRVTRSTHWQHTINPWESPDELPHFTGGLLAELIYGSKPIILNDYLLADSEPAREYIGGFRSLMAIPLYDDGESTNMVVFLHHEPNVYTPDLLPNAVWRGNLFGMATNNLVLKQKLTQAYASLDREFLAVGNMQRSLLPASLPTLPNFDLAAWYQPATRAGGDYYDFFPLSNGCLGLFIADVSGHGTPAAVIMAITHCIAHMHPNPSKPSDVLMYLNRHLSRYGDQTGRFVTAFYGMLDPNNLTLTYASAGHNPPRLKRCDDGSLVSLDKVGGFPLGITADQKFDDAVHQLVAGDQIVFYTDGITEAQNDAGELFGVERLDTQLENCHLQAEGLLESVLAGVNEHCQDHPADDDRTMIIVRVKTCRVC